MYYHSSEVHNLDSPNEIVPILIDLFQPNSVIDFGCGIGTFLNVFKNNGIVTLLGVDGPWVDKNKLIKYIDINEFKEVNFEKLDNYNSQKFDLVICLEVAEHLPSFSSHNLIKNLTNSGDFIVFSAAIPFQGGQNHLNEQWLTYWEDLFLKFDFELHDIIRPILWDNEKVFWWYKQNMVVFVKRGKKIDTKKYLTVPKSMRNIIHPELFNQKVERFQLFTKIKIKLKKIKNKILLFK